MTPEVVTTLVGTGSAAISSFITWLFSRRKENAEVDHTIIKGMQESLEFYEKLSDDTKQRLEESVKERNVMKEKIDKQGQEISELKTQVLRMSVSICYDLSCEYRKRKADENNK